MTKNFFNQKSRIFAHRGLPLEYPENTLLSFEKACELGVDVIETDIHFTKDNKFVIIHDSRLERVSNGKGNVTDYSLKELKKFDLGYNFTIDGRSYPYRGAGETFFSLEELLEKFPGQRFNIDLKDKNEKQIKYYMNIIKKYNVQERILTASKHYVNLKEVRKLLPEMATSFSMKEVLKFYISSKLNLPIIHKFKGDALQIPEFFKSIYLANNSLIKKANSMNIKVHIWTVNNEKDIKRLFNSGIDGIFTDNAKLAKKILSKYHQF